MIKVGWQTLFRMILPPELPDIYSKWLNTKWLSDILLWVLLKPSDYVSDTADAIRPPVTEDSESWPWLTRSFPGVTWSGLTPASATSCRVRSQSSILRPRWETVTTRKSYTVLQAPVQVKFLWLLILYWSNLETCVNKSLCPRRKEMIPSCPWQWVQLSNKINFCLLSVECNWDIWGSRHHCCGIS